MGLLGPSPFQQPPQASKILNGDVWRLTGHEVKEKHEKELCFYCDNKYMSGHCCTRPQMFMMVDVQTEKETTDVDMDIEPLEEAILEISFHNLVGTAHPQTFWVIRKVRNREVIMLIYRGSTHNFI